jgi:hypothetical protein
MTIPEPLKYPWMCVNNHFGGTGKLKVRPLYV